MDFVVREINNKFAKHLVFGTSSESPLFLLPEIKELGHFSNGDIILFDQLLQTGNTDNRFLLLEFDNDDFDLSTAKHIDGSFIESEVRAIIADFLRENTMLLRYSILLSKQKETILQGGTV